MSRIKTFFKWYWRLTQKVFWNLRVSREENFYRWFVNSFWSTLKWFLISGLGLYFLIFLAMLLPEEIRKGITDFLAAVGNKLAAIALFGWAWLDPIKPFFIWLGNWDWAGISRSAEAILLHLVIGVLVTSLGIIFCSLAAGLVFSRLRIDIDREKFLIIYRGSLYLSLVLSSWAGIYVSLGYSGTKSFIDSILNLLHRF